ncbi:MAG: GNAT family N-acetyltransferase [Endomicrobia bacterium]|nr:GNAT family N-acetyltransferase [Endomicrobiia bacterium]
MNNIGTQTIETKRLILRRVKPEDAEDMFYGWSSDGEVTKYMTWRSHPDIEATKNYINYLLTQLEKDDCYDWIIEYKETGKAIGAIGAVSLNENLEKAELGYCLSKKYWNKGIMSEALAAVMQYMFDKCGFNRLESFHIPENPASGKVMQKCGMKFEGMARQARKDNQGRFCDTMIYAAIKKEWRVESEE